MERIAQYFDDLEDLLFAFALSGERLRRIVKAIVRVCLALALLALGVLLAISEPPLALAIISLLTVTLLYRATVSHPRRSAASS